MATATLSIDRTGLSLSALVFDGADTGTTHVLVEMNEPARVNRTSYASAGRFMHGLVPVASTWEHTTLAATVRLEAASAAALETAKDALVAALGQFSFTVTTTVNGVANVWQAERGSMVLAGDSLEYENLRRDVERYRITIPVHPVAS